MNTWAFVASPARCEQDNLTQPSALRDSGYDANEGGWRSPALGLPSMPTLQLLEYPDWKSQMLEGVHQKCWGVNSETRGGQGLRLQQNALLRSDFSAKIAVRLCPLCP